MERKEHAVPTMSGGGKVLRLLDPDGNPYTPPDPVDYQILDEDGEILKEGTIKDTDEIPLDDISTTNFRVMIDSHLVLDTQGFESPGEDDEHKILEGPSFDPEDSSLTDDFTSSGGDDSGKDSEADSDNSDESSENSQAEGQGTSGDDSENSSELSKEDDDEQSDDEEASADVNDEKSGDKKDESASQEGSQNEDDQSDSEQSKDQESDTNTNTKNEND
jgi:hypothetical protein